MGAVFQIIWENRLKNDSGEDCLVSVDGTDFRVAQHGPKFSSHKFAGKSGLRYEVCLCIKTGEIVWVNGPYECGSWPDISIFRDSLQSHLGRNERCEADDGYIGDHPEYIKCPGGFANPQQTEFMQQRVRNRQETGNFRFKIGEYSSRRIDTILLTMVMFSGLLWWLLSSRSTLETGCLTVVATLHMTLTTILSTRVRMVLIQTYSLSKKLLRSTPLAGLSNSPLTFV